MEHEYQTPFGYAEWDIALSESDVRLLAEGFSPTLVQPEHLVYFENCQPDPGNIVTET